MATHSMSIGAIREQARESWVPMIAIALGQMIMSFNVASLPVALGGMVQKLRCAADDGRDRHRGLFDAGGRLRHAGRQARAAVRRAAGVPLRRGPVLRIADIDDLQPHRDVDDHGPGALRRGRRGDRAVAGGADRRELHGRQQATAVGALGSARAAAGVLAFIIGGVLGTYIGWRPAFGILIAVSAIVFLLSFRLKPD